MTFTACQKNGTVTGTLTNAVTGKPLQGIEVSVQGLNSGLGDKKKQMQQLGYGITDASGHFSVDIESKQNKKQLYEVYVFDEASSIDTTAERQVMYLDDFYNFYQVSPFFSATGMPPQNVALSIIPAARLRIVVKNNASHTIYERVRFSVYDDKATYYQDYKSMYYNADPTRYFVVPAGVTLNIRKVRVVNDVATDTIIETLVLDPFVKHHITYF